MNNNELTPDRPGSVIRLPIDAPTLKAIFIAGNRKMPKLGRNAYIRDALRRALEQDGER